MSFLNYVLKSLSGNSKEKQTLKNTNETKKNISQNTSFLKSKTKNQPKKFGNKIAIFEPQTLGDLNAIVCFMATEQQALLSFKKVDKKIFQRVLDFIAGAVLALGGKVENLGNGMFLFAPKNTQILNKGNIYEN